MTEDYDYYDEDDLGPDQDEIDAIDESVRFRDFVRLCPGCKRQVTEQMDSCPFCGDNLFDYFKDSTFAPKKGPLTKIFAAIIITLAVLGGLMFILASIRF